MATPSVYDRMLPVDNRSKWEKFSTSVWNAPEHKFLGRNGREWGQVALFYILFFLWLTVFFVICILILYVTLDENKPKWLLDNGIIGSNPGMTFSPLEDPTEETSLIRYDAKNIKSVKKWTDILDNYLELYLDSSKLPDGGKNQENCSFEKRPSAGKVCAVEVDKWSPCSRENGYGYNNSSPCFFLKLNRIFGWQADFYSDLKTLPKDMPTDLVNHIKDLSVTERRQIWVSCEGKNSADKLTIEYTPTRGFPSYYYPYTNIKGYLNPLVPVKLPSPKRNVLIMIECRAWAKNINYKSGRLEQEGSIYLEVQID